MSNGKKIKNALISVYHKESVLPLAKKLKEFNIKIYSTGGTQKFLEAAGIKVTSVESVTGYPSILGGRVKTLHPKIFGGILFRRENKDDNAQIKEYSLPEFDLIVVDLYPFEDTVKSTKDEQEIIEKIDIGGISLTRAAAKNFKDVMIVPSSGHYEEFINLIDKNKAHTIIEDRKRFAAYAFSISSHYDTAIYHYFNGNETHCFKQSIKPANILRYGENPHQKGVFYGNLEDNFKQLHGKQISYNNLLDLDAAVSLVKEFTDPTFAVIKHNNACGLASRETLLQAWKDALAGDPISAFGGVLVCNRDIDEETAKEINKLFFEIILAPGYEKNTLEILKVKKNRIILHQENLNLPGKQFKTVLNGVIEQDRDIKTETKDSLECVTKKHPSEQEEDDLVFANKIVKHTKSNAIVLAKSKQLLGSGTGQTSRVDALKHAIAKAKEFGFSLNGAVMASDAFFPFPDSVELAHKEGVRSVIQPGGSVRDKDSIEFCDDNGMSMVFTGTRHFKH